MTDDKMASLLLVALAESIRAFYRSETQVVLQRATHNTAM